MSKETIKLLLEALGYVLTPHGGTRAHVWDSDEARFVVQAYKALEEALANEDADAEIIKYHEATIARLQKELAKQEQGEPVAWMYPDALCDRNCLYLCTKGFTQFPECADTSRGCNDKG